MARLTNDQWQIVRADYEIQGLSYRELVEKHGISKATISRRANKENWLQGKVEHIVQKKVEVLTELDSISEQVEKLPPLEQQTIDKEVAERLAREKIFIDSAMRNQRKADSMLGSAEELSELNTHSQITARNKETVLGKQPQTAVQINNANNGTSVIDELVKNRL
ncbi:MAG: hypothetical protein KGV51_04720 [Moraxellaceae bacterium]|nr:hypothetical protein [Moraxellaceae bacterium]